jgi:hypothetical protein
LELFEDAPDDTANWGEAVSTEKKLYKTSSSDSDDNTSTDGDGKSKSRKVWDPSRVL